VLSVVVSRCRFRKRKKKKEKKSLTCIPIPEYFSYLTIYDIQDQTGTAQDAREMVGTTSSSPPWSETVEEYQG
jgi:hypothetical protein